MVVVGTKLDLPRKVSGAEIQEFLKTVPHMLYIETSAKSGENVGQVSI